ncbi:MAG: hypothetical protein K6G00_12895 [Treponema sp.]|nr:hypothetical protein [Treponema sp.]
MKKAAFMLAFCALVLTAQAVSQESIETTESITPASAIPSRSITLQKNQYLDVVYPGTGWIYLGEIDATSLLKYSGRKMSEETTSFTLRGREEGSAILHFFKNDALTGDFIDDYLAVTIQGSSRTSDHIKAPSYAEIVPPRPSFTKSAIIAEAEEKANEEEIPNKLPSDNRDIEEAAQALPVAKEQKPESENHSAAAVPNAKGTTVIQNTSDIEQSSNVTSSNKSQAEITLADNAAASEQNVTEKKSSEAESTESLSASEILSKAQKAFDDKQYEQCLSYLDSFFEKTEENIDEGMYLQGRTLESPSSLRDIKKSLSIYKTIVRQYPESSVWEKANERITYIERFYFDIR